MREGLDAQAVQYRADEPRISVDPREHVPVPEAVRRVVGRVVELRASRALKGTETSDRARD